MGAGLPLDGVLDLELHATAGGGDGGLLPADGGLGVLPATVTFSFAVRTFSPSSTETVNGVEPSLPEYHVSGISLVSLTEKSSPVKAVLSTLGGHSLRKDRIIEWFSSGGNFSRLRTAKIEGYLAGNRDFCRQLAAVIHPLMGREHCAVVP